MQDINLNNELFEGVNKINIFYKNRDEYEDYFIPIKNGLNLNDDIDLYLLCVSIYFYLIEKDRAISLKTIPSSKELAKMYTFKKAEIYDRIIIHGLNNFNKRIDYLANCFYTGFQIIKKWWDLTGEDKKDELDRFISLEKYIFNYKE